MSFFWGGAPNPTLHGLLSEDPAYLSMTELAGPSSSLGFLSTRGSAMAGQGQGCMADREVQAQRPRRTDTLPGKKNHTGSCEDKP
jgi:hypothetical protein